MQILRAAAGVRAAVATAVVAACVAWGGARSALADTAPGEEGPAGLPALGDGVAARPGLRATKAAAGADAPVHRQVRVAPLDVAALEREDDDRRAAPGVLGRRWNRVGVLRSLRPVTVPPTPSRWRRAQTLPDGSRVFRIALSAPGATGVRVEFREWRIPKGSDLTVANARDPSEVYGPLRVPDAASAATSWLAPTVFGDRVVVSLRVPADRLDERVRLTVDGIAQRYDRRSAAAQTRAATSTSCIRDVACDPDYTATVARGVGRMEFTSGRNVFLCSGALLTDLDATTDVPWFLTANHCVSTEAEAQTVEVFWDYRAATCGGATPSLSSVPRTVGSTLVATTATSDCTLLRLTGALPSNRYFCGWTSDTPQRNTSITGVHHPQGFDMRISYGTITDWDADFHTVVWNDGVTAEGSSGSPILDGSMHVLGQLYGGSSYCSRPRDPDYYGRFDVSYPAILAEHLGKPAAALAPDAWDPGDDTPAGATDLGSPGAAVVESGGHTLAGDDAADWFAADLDAAFRYVLTSTGAVRIGVWADAGAADLVASTPGSSSGASLSVVPAGTQRHWIRVERATAGSDVAYALDVSRQQPPPVPAPTRVRASARSRGGVLVTWRPVRGAVVGYDVDLMGRDDWVRVGEVSAPDSRFRHVAGPGLHTYRVGAHDAFGTTTWTEATVRVKGPRGPDRWDPVDDTGAWATPLGVSSGQVLTDAHVITRSDVADWFRFDLAGGASATLTTEGTGDTVGDLYADAGGLDRLATADDQTGGTAVGRNFRIDFTAPATGTYWLRVTCGATRRRTTYQVRITVQ